MNFVDELRAFVRDGFQSNNLRSCSRWAEHRRVMGAPFNGPYGFGRHPWCREIHDSQAAWTIAMKAAQLGVTETGINRAFYTLDQLKRDVLYVLPTNLNASDFSKARFATALKLSPYLKKLFVDTNTVGLKSTGQNVLYIRGSRGDSNMKSIPVSELVLDELDEMDTHAVWLALERLSGQIEKHILAISTPTVPKYGIHKLYLTSTQEHFYFQCPHCGRRTELLWPDCVEIIGESVNDPRCKESFLKCKECKHKLDHEAKQEFLAGGKWEATETNVSAEESRGFYINQLYSTTVTPGELVIAYHRGLGDEAAATEFHCSKLGVPVHRRGCPGHGRDDRRVHQESHSINDVRPTDRRRPPDNDGRGPGEDQLRLGRRLAVRPASRRRHQCGGHRQAVVVRHVSRRYRTRTGRFGRVDAGVASSWPAWWTRTPTSMTPAALPRGFAATCG